MKRTLSLLLVLIALIGIAYGATLQPFSFPFVGKWNPSENPLLLDDYGLQDVQNVRKTGKHFKGVSGHTKINTSVPSAGYPYFVNGFHFRKDQPAESHVIVYAADSLNPTDGRLYQNTTAIPTAGDFSATALYTPTAFNDVWRFSNAPAGNMVASNGDATLIWGGDEIEATMIVTSSSTVAYTLTNPNEYTDILNNTRQTSDQVATFLVSGGSDAYTTVLIHADGNDAGTTFTNAINGAAVTAVNQAQTDTASYKFGSASALFDGTGDAIRAGAVTDFKYLHNGSNWTFDCWYKAAGFAAEQTFFSTAIVDTTQVGAMAYINANRTVSVKIVYGSAGNYILNFTTTGTVPNDTNWHHIAVTYDHSVANSNCKVYVDGTQLTGAGNKTGGAPSAGNSSYVFNVGQLGDGSSYPFNGQIDEIRLSSTVRWTADFTAPTQAYGAANNYILVGSKRPLKGVKFYVYSANTSSSTLTCKEWQGISGWADLTLTDNTASGGVTLAQTGTVAWTATSAAQPRYLNGLSLYWYQFYFDAGRADVYYMTTDAAIQSIPNIWDGVESYTAKCLKYNGTTFVDYTDSVGDDSEDTYADVSSLQTTHYILVGFLEPQQAIDVKMVATSPNATSSTSMTVSYWNGSDWEALAAQNDGTASSTTSLARGGVVSWQAASRGTEWKRAIADEFPLYYYKIQFAAALDADTKIAEIYGIASPEALATYKFSETFQNRLFLFNEKNGAKNRSIYSVENAGDIFNGSDSGELLFGDRTELTSASVVYNVFMNTAVEQLLVTKKYETYRVSGDGPSNWVVNRMSGNIGCVAPLSMVSCEVTDTTAEVKRTVAIWVSDKGPVMSDGATIIPIFEDVKCYWDANDAKYIPASMQSKSVGWYDPSLQSYKLLIASGSTATYLNTELEYSLKYKEWTKVYRENGSGANPLQSGFQVHDTNGLGYTYGGGKDGFLYRLENGNSWAGTSIASYLHTKDMILDNEKPIFRKSTVKYLRTLYKQKATGDITISHYGDRTLTVSGSSGQYGPGIISNASTTYYDSKTVNLGPFLYHSFKYSASTSVADGLELTGMGVYFEQQEQFR